MTAIGTSFTRRRAQALGLDDQRAFARICEKGFDIVRLSASWREVREAGYRHLDWMLDYAAAARQPIVLTVGMKALGWPEFYLPDGLDPSDRATRRLALSHVEDVVIRYAGHPTLLAWQVENEPFNRSGPQARWIPRLVVRREADAVRRYGGSRPLIVTTFAHFNESLDRASSRHQAKWTRRLGVALPAEREALAVLRHGDILGVDVYRAIGWLDESGVEQVGRASPDQLDWIGRWRRIAGEQRKRLWVMEAQAEPWEPRGPGHGEPRTIAPADISRLVEALALIGVETVLLWGSEHWLWREEQGDSRWIEALPLGRRALA